MVRSAANIDTHYHEGRNYYAKETTEDNLAAIASFKKCLELEPTYALAYVGLSLAYTQRAIKLNQGRSWLNDAAAACEAALAIDDGLIEAYRALWMAAYPRLQVSG